MKRKFEEEGTVSSKIQKVVKSELPEEIFSYILEYLVELDHPMPYLIVNKLFNKLVKNHLNNKMSGKIWVLSNFKEIIPSSTNTFIYDCYTLSKLADYEYDKQAKMVENDGLIDIEEEKKLLHKDYFIMVYMDDIYTKFKSEISYSLYKYDKFEAPKCSHIISWENGKEYISNITYTIPIFMEEIIYMFNGVLTDSYLLWFLMNKPREWMPNNANIWVHCKFYFEFICWLKKDYIQFETHIEDFENGRMLWLEFTRSDVNYKIIFTKKLKGLSIFSNPIEIARCAYDGKRIYLMYDVNCLNTKKSGYTDAATNSDIKKYRKRGFKI